MMKLNLPVIVLKGIILLPNNDIRLEFDNDNTIIDTSELFHDNKLLIVNQTNPLDEVFDIDSLPKYGVIAKISHKIKLPNGKLRVVIKGIKRAYIDEYLNNVDILEAIVEEKEEVKIDEKSQIALIRKLYREIENYIKSIPYVSNSVLSIISNIKDISILTDIIVPHLPISLARLEEYLKENNPIIRSNMILKDVAYEEEVFNIEKKIDLKIKEELDSSQKEYILKEKIKAMKEELGETSYKENEIDKINERLEQLDAPSHIIERIKVELKRYESLSSMSPEVTIARDYIDWLLNLPWNKMTDDNIDLKDVRNKLDASHDGLDNVKKRIIEYLAVKQKTGSLKGPIICLVGPPGVGKTSLAFSIAEAMNRNFVKMSVGGVNDESEIIGHRRTYLGANPGRIIQSLKKAKSSNPVFLIDEIDKMTKDIKGDPASCLLEILDPEQNKYFSDNYIEEEVDLSNVLFITTANYIDQIPHALKDRLKIINISGYTEYEKLAIAKKHLIPKICKNNGLDHSYIKFEDSAIKDIINFYTREAGVRELERQIDTIVRKIVTSMVMQKIVIRSLNITSTNLSQYLGKRKYHFISNNASIVGVVNGLAYTSYGGDTLPIEVNYYKGDGKLVLTGSLGDVMKESAHIALSYIKSNYKDFKIDYDKLLKNDIHIHVPEGAIPKDGPSAGIALTTALISTLSNQKVPKNLAMTGEITLRGNVLPIGGLKEKSIGANRNGIKTVIIPYENLKDLEDVPKEVKDKIEYITVKNYKDVYKYLWKN